MRRTTWNPKIPQGPDMVEQSKHLGTWSRTLKLAPLPFHQGFRIDHGGNLISTWHLDFRMPDELADAVADLESAPVDDLAGLLARVEIPEG